MPIRPPVVALGYLVLAWGLDHGLGAPRVVPRPWVDAGLLLFGAGGILIAWSIVLFRRAGTSHDPAETPTALVESGPYRLTRNPMYLGLATILLGIGLVVGTVPFLFVPAAFLLTMNLAYVPREERALEEAIGEPYQEYRKRVRRWRRSSRTRFVMTRIPTGMAVSSARMVGVWSAPEVVPLVTPGPTDTVAPSWAICRRS
jgi:protein-S-isoprenylcysteine O-methyltransferase Ste14